ncbi:uncharacterized protein [Anabrus simplex]|uniref:uncharacterized protein isoform X2 n=1 Tax=Anabrus simplex TaxID=316456 RepID=UPI0034DCF638
MVELWVAVLVIGMILSPVKSSPHSLRQRHAWLDNDYGESTLQEDTTTTTRPAPVINNCVFYDRVDDGYYHSLRLHIMKKTWSQAKSTCEREGGHLASPRSGQELELYMDYLSRLRQAEKWFWIGVRRNSVRDPWMTVQGDVLTDEKLLDGSWSLPGNPLAETGCWRILDGYVRYTNCTTDNFRSAFLCEREIC